jgi:hypothetical protein
MRKKRIPGFGGPAPGSGKPLPGANDIQPAASTEKAHPSLRMSTLCIAYSRANFPKVSRPTGLDKTG